ncbi:MAG: DUF169 domain-containing protein [Promethearchaeota archaeon]
MNMESPNIAEIGTMLKEFGRLEWSPVLAYTSPSVPEGAVATRDINRCVARVVFEVARAPVSEAPTAFIRGGDRRGLCPGVAIQLGIATPPPPLKYFISVGGDGYSGRTPEYLRASPELVEAAWNALGESAPFVSNLILTPCERVEGGVLGGNQRAGVVCCGPAESIRNLAALVHFRSTGFHEVIVPWGPACATLVAYPLHFRDKVPRDCAFMGPVDPTLNDALPPGYMALGVPLGLARRMARDAGSSFLGKRPDVAFPDHGEP